MNELTQDNLGEILQNNEKVFVLYGASWCGNCRMIKPKVSSLASETQEVSFYYVDAEKFPGSREFAEITNLPTFAVFNQGKLVKQAMGNKIEKVQELVNEVTNN